MNTTIRCALGLLVALGLAATAQAQVARQFTATTLRGAITFGDFPQITLNGTPVRLSPGARVRNQANLIVNPVTLTGSQVLANYTLDLGATQVRDVWILTPQEAAVQPWPATADQAASWTFDVIHQTWTPP